MDLIEPVISADCHIDLIWLPPELFVENARLSLKDRMPYVTDSKDGPIWVSSSGAYFGLQNGMGTRLVLSPYGGGWTPAWPVYSPSW